MRAARAREAGCHAAQAGGQSGVLMRGVNLLSKHLLTTERLLLREATEADARFMLSLLLEHAWRAFIADHDVSDVKGASAYLQQRIIPGYREGRGLWLVQLKGLADPAGNYRAP